MLIYTFEFPYVFFLLFLYFVIILFFKVKQQSYFIPNLVEKLPAITPQKDFRNILKHLIIVSAIFALASPIKTENIIDLNKHTLDIILSLDTSGSMSLKGLNRFDYNQTRLDVVKTVVKDFIKKRSKDRIGLVIFGDKSSVAAPLSNDNEAILSIVENITIGVVGKSTALIDSILSASNLLEKSFSSSKIMILLSDGDDTASKVPLDIALKVANKYKIKIYTVAIGESNNNLLNIISQQSGAKSFVATDKEDLKEIYQSITKLEATTHNSNTIKVISYCYQYFLYLTLISAFALALLVQKSEDL